jgi:peptide-methionine (S)-S-oxide reductase
VSFFYYSLSGNSPGMKISASLPEPGTNIRWMDDPGQYQRGTFAAGCFWDVEAAFRVVDGVLDTVAGYTGGSVPDPRYEQVDSGTTGHVQAVGVIFDPALVSYRELLEVFFRIHDPTQADGQGDYAGSQYRSVIFYHSDEQKDLARQFLDRIAVGKNPGDALVRTEILPASQFWPAEESHQRFYEKCANSYCTSRQVDG